MLRLGPTHRIDWFQVIIDLGRRGYTPQSVADAIHVPRTTLLGWKQGAEPKHADGEKLVAMWSSCCGLSRDQVPMTPLHPWVLP